MGHLTLAAPDDARPDRWGERGIRFIDKPPRLSLLEFLYLAGDDRFGALGVSTSQAHYEPRRPGPLPTLADAAAIHELVRKVLANEAIRCAVLSPAGASTSAPAASAGAISPCWQSRSTGRSCAVSVTGFEDHYVRFVRFGRIRSTDLDLSPYW